MVPGLSLDDSLPAMARRVLDAAPSRFALSGLSMEGYLALEIMRHAPERVERLALLNTSAMADTPEQIETREALIALTRRWKFEKVPRHLLSLLIHPDRIADTERFSHIVAMARCVFPYAFIRQEQAIMARPDSPPDLKRIHCPNLVLCGRQDALTPLAVAEEIAENIAGSRLVVVEDCGHLSTMERPRVVSAVLQYWLQ